jgi:hypothetical protein
MFGGSVSLNYCFVSGNGAGAMTPQSAGRSTPSRVSPAGSHRQRVIEEMTGFDGALAMAQVGVA